MKIAIRFFVAASTLYFGTVASADSPYAPPQLSSGVSVTLENLQRIAYQDPAYPMARCPRGACGDLSAYISMAGSDIYYSMHSDLHIYSFNFSTKQYLGGWLLSNGTPCQWDDFDCTAPWYAGRWSDQEVLEQLVIDRYGEYHVSLAFSAPGASDTLGCLGRYPLRYGDLDGDGVQELVVVLQSRYGAMDWAVFSTALHKVVFATRLGSYDAKENDRQALPEDEDGESASNPLADDPNDPQYLSLMAEENTRMVKGIDTGFVSLAKLYLGDFDSDDHFDIVVWRKSYESRTLNDPVKGFELKEELYAHYEIDNGEYKKQSTEQANVKGWLTSKSLTWKAGYPSVSECEGQSGQLIPEFHDPLLNDSTVLQ